jgi:hypothetical protein
MDLAAETYTPPCSIHIQGGVSMLWRSLEEAERGAKMRGEQHHYLPLLQERLLAEVAAVAFEILAHAHVDVAVVHHV